MSIHQAPCNDGGRIVVLIHECVGPIHDACNTLNAHRRGWDNRTEEVAHDYHSRHGESYDIPEDQSPSPAPLGPQVFGRHIINAPFSSRY
jgi:hypothetical protein